jgi:hypothetical protein
MTVFNVATDLNALITTDSSSPPRFQLNNVQALADAINGGVVQPTFTRNVSAVTVPLFAAATAPVQLAPSRATRKSLMIHNPSANPLRIAFTSTAGAPIYILLSAGGTMTMNDSSFPWTGAVFGLSNNGTGYQVVVGEVYA